MPKPVHRTYVRQGARKGYEGNKGDATRDRFWAMRGKYPPPRDPSSGRIPRGDSFEIRVSIGIDRVCSLARVIKPAVVPAGCDACDCVWLHCFSGRGCRCLTRVRFRDPRPATRGALYHPGALCMPCKRTLLTVFFTAHSSAHVSLILTGPRPAAVSNAIEETEMPRGKTSIWCI